MAFQSAPNTAELVIKGDISGKGVANVINFYNPFGYDQSDIDALATLGDAWVGSDYIPLFANSVTYNECLVRGLTDIIDLTGSAAANTGPGTLSGSAMPANASVCITMRTGFTGRSARGRFYAWPFSSSVLATSQSVTSGYVDDLADALNLLRSQAASAGWTMSVLSRYTLGSARPLGICTAITDCVGRNVLVDSARRRLGLGH